MPVLLFGRNGFIGSHIYTHLQTLGLEVHGYSREQCDLRDADALSAIMASFGSRPLHIINAAVANKSTANDQAGFLGNTALASSFLAAVEQARIAHFIHLSSFDVYGHAPALPITEQTPAAAEDWYGLAKIITEQMLALHPSLQGKLTILRLPGVYSAAAHAGDTSVVGRLRRAIRQGTAVLHGGGKSLRDVVLVDDLARIAGQLAARNEGAGIVNIVTGRSVPVHDLFSLLAEQEKIAVQPQFTEATDRQFDIVADPARCRSLFPAPLASPKDALAKK